MKRGPIVCDRCDRYVFIAKTGQSGDSIDPTVIVCPMRKGSVLDSLLCTVIKLGVLAFFQSETQCYLL